MAAQRIQRDHVRATVFLALAAGAAGFAVWACIGVKVSLARWGLTILGAVVALLLWGYGTGTAGTVVCPSCGATIDKIDPKRNAAVLCSRCLEYASGDHGTVDKTPEDFVAAVPAFGADLPPQVAWPTGCCVCEQPATRLIEAKLVDEHPGSPGRDLLVGVASLGILKAVDRTTYTINAPHCSEHKDGVALVAPVEPDVPVAIAFRSYSYYRRFRTANTTRPRKLVNN